MGQLPLHMLAEVNWKQWAGVVMIAAAVVLLLRSSSRWIKGKRRLSDRESEDRAARKILDQAEIRPNLERLIVDLQDLARQINAHIDTRFCKLEVLIKHADERIKRLEQLTGGGESAGAGEKRPDSGSPADEAPPDPEREMIYKLADSGKGAVEIAQELNKHPGEVELILSLRRTGQGGKIDYRIDD